MQQALKRMKESQSEDLGLGMFFVYEEPEFMHDEVQ